MFRRALDWGVKDEVCIKNYQTFLSVTIPGWNWKDIGRMGIGGYRRSIVGHRFRKLGYGLSGTILIRCVFEWESLSKTYEQIGGWENIRVGYRTEGDTNNTDSLGIRRGHSGRILSGYNRFGGFERRIRVGNRFRLHGKNTYTENYFRSYISWSSGVISENGIGGFWKIRVGHLERGINVTGYWASLVGIRIGKNNEITNTVFMYLGGWAWSWSEVYIK